MTAVRLNGVDVRCGTCKDWAGRPETRMTGCPLCCCQHMNENDNYCPGWTSKHTGKRISDLWE